MPRALVLPLLLLALSSSSSSSTSSPLPVPAWPPNRRLLFDYSTAILLSENLGITSRGPEVKISAKVALSKAATLPNDGILLRVDLSDARVEGDTSPTPLPGPPPAGPAFLTLHDGAVDRLHLPAAESAFWVNVVRGLASLVHSRATTGEVREVDASGECRNMYRADPAAPAEAVVRSKRRCSPLDLSEEVTARGEGRRAARARTGKTVLRLREGLLASAVASDTVMVSVPLAGGLGAMAVEAQQQLKLRGTEAAPGEVPEAEEEAALKSVAPGEVRAISMAAENEDPKVISEVQLRAVVEAAREGLGTDRAATTEAVAAFRRVLAAARGVKDGRVLEKVLADDEYTDVITALLDAAVVCGTGPCLHAVLRRLNFTDAERAEEEERLLLGLSHLAEPDEATVDHLLGLARRRRRESALEKVDGLETQLWATLGALAGRHRLAPTGKYSKISTEAVTFLSEQLGSPSTDEDAVLAALTALTNTGDAPEAISPILKLLINGSASHRVHCAAIDSLEALGIPDDLRGLARSRALRLVQSRPFRVDVTARLRALDLLLSLYPTLSQLKAAGRACGADPHLRHAFVDRAGAWCRRESRPDLWQRLQEVLPGLLRYPDPPGLPPHTEEADFLPGNATAGETEGHFRMDLITDADGAVRRSDTRAVLSLSDGSELGLYSVSVFADGLGSVGASGEEASKGDGDVTAGIGMSLLGVGMRPVRFFSGYSGLMGAVWNAPTSLTPFLQANLAFVDSRHLIHLQNGFSVRFSASGLTSIDLSGLVSISMWSQKADTKLQTRAAVDLTVALSLSSSRLSAEIFKNASAVVAMDFDSSVSFSAMPPKICLLASYPDTWMAWRVAHTASVKDKGSKTAKDIITGRRFVPGKMFSLGRANEKSCSQLMTAE